MVTPPLPVPASLAVTVSDLKTLRQLAESGQLKTWQAGAIMDVVVNRREGGLLLLDSGKGLLSLQVPADSAFKPGTALQLQVLTLAPLQIQLRPAPTAGSTNKTPPLPAAPLTDALLRLSDRPAIGTGGATNIPLPPIATAPVSNGPPSETGRPNQPTAEPPALALSRQLANLLRPLLNQASDPRLPALPSRISEWLARTAPLLPEQLPELPAGAPAAKPAELIKLAEAVLGSWPSRQQASEPDELTTLLRQALFAEPAASANTGSARSSTDWLGSLARLLMALPNPAALPASTGHPVAAQSSAQPATRADEKAALPLPTPLPFPDELIEELAGVLGRQQQHWLNNVQTDARQQPLFAELLLRNGERVDPFELSVREEPGQRDDDDPEARHHVVRLRFDLPGLGVCQFLLDLNADDLQLHFYSERAETIELFQQHLDALAAPLAADAIHLTQVQAHRVEQLPALAKPAEHGFHVRV